MLQNYCKHQIPTDIKTAGFLLGTMHFHVALNQVSNTLKEKQHSYFTPFIAFTNDLQVSVTNKEDL